MRFTRQIYCGKTNAKTVMCASPLYVYACYQCVFIVIDTARGMDANTFYSATSGPNSPVYLWARREVLEQELEDLIAWLVSSRYTQCSMKYVASEV